MSPANAVLRSGWQIFFAFEGYIIAVLVIERRLNCATFGKFGLADFNV